jgi:NADPH-dependent F420 reductase
MRVAMIGSGNVGRTLGRALRAAGHDVTFSAAHPERAAAAADELGAVAASSNAEATRDADVVILAMPFAAGPTVAHEIAETAAGKVVIDVTNTSVSSVTELAPNAASAAEAFAAWLPGAHVVKAFNTAFAGRMANPVQDGRPLDGFVAGDDEAAKAAVMTLVADVGFEPIDGGPLANAAMLEGLAMLNIWMNANHGWDWTSAWRLAR